MKKIKWGLVLLIILIFVAEFLQADSVICNSYNCNTYYDALLLNTLIFSALVLTIMGVVNYLGKGVKQLWWSFSRISVPLTFIGIFFIALGGIHSNNEFGFFSLQQEFDLIAFGILYLIYIFGSIIQIIRGYRLK